MPRPSHIPAVAAAILDLDPKTPITNAILVAKTNKHPRTVTTTLAAIVARGGLRKHGDRGPSVTYTALRRPLKALAA